MTTQDTENQAGGAEPTEAEVKMQQQVAYENKAAAESTIESAEGNGQPLDTTASVTTSGVAASTVSTEAQDGPQPSGEVQDGGSAPIGAPRGDTHAA